MTRPGEHLGWQWQDVMADEPLVKQGQQCSTIGVLQSLIMLTLGYLGHRPRLCLQRFLNRHIRQWLWVAVRIWNHGFWLHIYAYSTAEKKKAIMIHKGWGKEVVYSHKRGISLCNLVSVSSELVGSNSLSVFSIAFMNVWLRKTISVSSSCTETPRLPKLTEYAAAVLGPRHSQAVFFSGISSCEQTPSLIIHRVITP